MINRRLSQARTGSGFTTVLGLVGWITYWCNGDSALTVDVVVVFINILDLKELVSVALTGTKHKEAETNAKIVDLVKHALDETKNCRNEHRLMFLYVRTTCHHFLFYF